MLKWGVDRMCQRLLLLVASLTRVVLDFEHVKEIKAI